MSELIDLDEAERRAARSFGGFVSDPNRDVSTISLPEPKPLPDGLLPVDPFDLEFLPTSIGPWVADIADRMQCPLDFVGVPATVALGSVIGRKIGVRCQRFTDWIEVPNLWGCIVGRPGTMKSPAMQQALAPLHRLEAEARKENEAASRSYAVELEVYKLCKEDSAKKARTALKGGGDIDGLLDIAAPDEPKAEREAIAIELGGVPKIYASEFARLQAYPPAEVPRERWEQFINDAGLFFDQRGKQAEALGWRADELFGLDPVAPMARYDRMGLVWMLRGQTVIDITAMRARLSGGLAYRRK